MDTDTVILLFIVFIVGVLIGSQMKNKKMNNAENIVNLDDSRKIELSKCCTDPKCYSKPPHLRINCEENKNNSKEMIDKTFTQMYTQEEYYKKLEDLGITKKGQLTNVQIDKAYLDKMNERLVINPALDENTDKTIRKDDRDEVRGYDESSIAPYKA
jgi:hypothetical protein